MKQLFTTLCALSVLSGLPAGTAQRPNIGELAAAGGRCTAGDIT